MTRLILVFLLSAATASSQEIVLTQVATGLNQPVALTHAGDTRLFITLQVGAVVIHDGANVLSTPFLDIRSLVSCCGERGLLSVAFHPNYRDNGFFYVDYTRADGDIVVARYRVSASDPNRADPNSGFTLLTLEHSQFGNHNGGQLQFGPDGYLYIGTGDGGSAGDPNNRAQTLGDPLGKILRIDVDRAAPYIPPSNPFANTPGARGEVWAYGLRNPWRFSFDRQTGDLFIADVGQNLWEEIDFQPRTSGGGENYGWRRMEGTHCFNPSTNCSDPSFKTPIIEYSHADGCSVSGGYRYRGARMPSLRGDYFYGDYCSGTIWVATQNGDGSWTSRHLLERTSLDISAFGEDLNGELYVLDLKGNVFAFSEKTALRTRHRAVAH